MLRNQDIHVLVSDLFAFALYPRSILIGSPGADGNRNRWSDRAGVRRTHAMSALPGGDGSVRAVRGVRGKGTPGNVVVDIKGNDFSPVCRDIRGQPLAVVIPANELFGNCGRVSQVIESVRGCLAVKKVPVVGGVCGAQVHVPVRLGSRCAGRHDQPLREPKGVNLVEP